MLLGLNAALLNRKSALNCPSLKLTVNSKATNNARETQIVLGMRAQRFILTLVRSCAGLQQGGRFKVFR